MSLLFEPKRRRVNRLSKMSLAELSVVDQPAQGLATFILKRRGGADMPIGFSPLLIQKRAEPDGEDDPEDAEPDAETENDTSDAEGEDDTQRRRPARKQARTAVATTVRPSIAKAARARSGSDVDGVDNRSDDEKAADAERVARACIAKPPVASERVGDWLQRVFGRQLAGLDFAELAIARKLFGVLSQASDVQKLATDALAEIAKRRAVVDTSKSYYQHWRDIAAEHPEFYSAMREHAQAAPVAKATARRDGDGSVSGAEDDGGDAFVLLNREADDIRKASGGKLTKEKAFLKACAEHPNLYQKLRGR